MNSSLSQIQINCLPTWPHENFADEQVNWLALSQSSKTINWVCTYPLKRKLAASLQIAEQESAILLLPASPWPHAPRLLSKTQKHFKTQVNLEFFQTKAWNVMARYHDRTEKNRQQALQIWHCCSSFLSDKPEGRPTRIVIAPAPEALTCERPTMQG